MRFLLLSFVCYLNEDGWLPENGGELVLYLDENGKEAEKAKRRSKVQRLVDGLDDRELDELRTRLMSSDDSEATSLEELLKANSRQRR